MKNVLHFIIANLISLSLFSQDTTRITTQYRNGKTFDTYLKNSNGEKEGTYIQYSGFGKKYIEGQYKNGIPVGIWNYYSSDTAGVLVQTLNFDTHTETFVDSNKVTSMICGPRFFGGRMAENEYIAYRVKRDFTSEEIAANKGLSLISFSIDPKTLKPVGITADGSNSSVAAKAKLVKIISEMPAWLPPVCKDKSEVWRFSLPVTL